MGLARHYQSGQAMKAETLAEEQGIPASYLVQILIQLKSKHIVQSLRGKAGGYRLARPPAEITLGEVIRCVHGSVFDTTALADSRCPVALREAWEDLQKAVDRTADAITYQKLLERGESGERMYYI